MSILSGVGQPRPRPVHRQQGTVGPKRRRRRGFRRAAIGRRAAAAHGASPRQRGRRSGFSSHGNVDVARRIAAPQPGALRRRRRRLLRAARPLADPVGGARRRCCCGLVFTSFHAISPGQRGVVTRFGRYSTTLGPGVSLTLPSPIDRVHEDRRREYPRRSTSARPSSEDLMLTGDQNLIDIAYSVRWNIRTPELYLFQLAEPDQTISEVAESAMRAVVSQVSARATRWATAAATSRPRSPTGCSASSTAIAPASRSRASRSSRPTRRRRGQRRVQASHRRAAGRADLHQQRQRLFAAAAAAGAGRSDRVRQGL